jgi:hypothetical protein
MRINVTELGGEPLPMGVYDLEIVDCKETVSKAGNPMVALEFLEPESGEKLRLFATLQPGKCFTIIDILKAVGADLTPDENGEIELDEDALVGCHVRAEVTHETYEGRTRAVPRKFSPVQTKAGRRR